MKISVLSCDNKKVRDKEVSDDLFGQELREDIVARVIRWQLARYQLGNHKTKTMSEVSGTTKKPFKQKGTGSARQGSKRAVHMRGGGTVFGPVVRTHDHKLNKKVRKLGLKVALSDKMAAEKLVVLDDFTMESKKTKDFKVFADKFGVNLSKESVLIIDGNDVNDSLYYVTSNFHNVDVLPQAGANVYDIVRKSKVFMTEKAVDQLQERL